MTPNGPPLGGHATGTATARPCSFVRSNGDSSIVRCGHDGVTAVLVPLLGSAGVFMGEGVYVECCVGHAAALLNDYKGRGLE